LTSSFSFSFAGHYLVSHHLPAKKIRETAEALMPVFVFKFAQREASYLFCFKTSWRGAKVWKFAFKGNQRQHGKVWRSMAKASLIFWELSPPVL